MSAMASQITSLTIVYSTVYWGTDQRKHQSSAPLAFVRGIHRWPVNSMHKWPVMRKMFPFDDVIMLWYLHFETRTNWSTFCSHFQKLCKFNWWFADTYPSGTHNVMITLLLCHVSTGHTSWSPSRWMNTTSKLIYFYSRKWNVIKYIKLIEILFFTYKNPELIKYTDALYTHSH